MPSICSNILLWLKYVKYTASCRYVTGSRRTWKAPKRAFKVPEDPWVTDLNSYYNQQKCFVIIILDDFLAL
jgi:hypothetical protein